MYTSPGWLPRLRQHLHLPADHLALPDNPDAFARITETLARAIDRKYPGRCRADSGSSYGQTYQNGVMPGPRKLAQFWECLALRATPQLYKQGSLGRQAIVHVRIFNPTGGGTWYLTEWDGKDEAFGLVDLHEQEFGYIPLGELAEFRGRFGIGLELDMHFAPARLEDCLKADRR